MPIMSPVEPENASESLKAIYERIKETIGKGEVSRGHQILGNVEPFLQDTYMNVRKFIEEGSELLDHKTREAIALATSSAQNCTGCTRSHANKAVAQGWTENQVAEILAVTATCAMYNTYYKFKDLSGDEAFKGYSVGLRAHTFQKTSLGDTVVELINIVVSNINGCEMCTAGHVKKALALGLTHEQIDEAIKVSATMTALNVFHRTN